MLWEISTIIIIMGYLSIVFKINIVPMSLLGYLNGIIYYNGEMETGSVFSLIIVLLIYSHLTVEWVTHFMAFLITLGFTVIYSPRALGESKKDLNAINANPKV
jgi:surface polysaccharide O-acyltransferase-like enzyme